MIADLEGFGYDGNSKHSESFAETYAMKKYSEKNENFDNYRWNVDDPSIYDKLVKFIPKV